MKGHFNYIQHKFPEVAEELQNIIDRNEYSERGIDRIAFAKRLMELAFIYIDTIDSLESGDCSEETFHERLWDALDKLEL